jgi:hypothetical protein
MQKKEDRDVIRFIAENWRQLLVMYNLTQSNSDQNALFPDVPVADIFRYM